MKAAYILQPGRRRIFSMASCRRRSPTARSPGPRGRGVVNPIDTYIRSGVYAAKLPRPFVIGCDLAGTVEKVGPEVRGLKPGDRVWGSNQGCWAAGLVRRVCGRRRGVALPDARGVSDQDAAAIALVGITAHLGTFRDAKLRAGETLFVHGGSGGVGSCVLQMAKIAGARAATTAGSVQKAEVCRRLGADLAIEYKTEDVDEALSRFAPDGVNVWFETLREQNLVQASATCLPRADGDHGGARRAAAVPVGPFYSNDCSLYGFAMFKARRTSSAAPPTTSTAGWPRASCGRRSRG